MSEEHFKNLSPEDQERLKKMVFKKPIQTINELRRRKTTNTVG
jgi:hypothetical protein